MIITTTINNYNKITRRSTTIDGADLFQFTGPSDSFITQNSATGKFIQQDIDQALAGLNEDFRKPFMMYYIGYKYLEIAEKLQIPIGTVKNRIHIARKELKKMLFVYNYN